MYVKQCFSALACALTVGLATGGQAQTVTSNRFYNPANSQRHANTPVNTMITRETSSVRIQPTTRGAGSSRAQSKKIKPVLLSLGEAMGSSNTIEIPASNISVSWDQNGPKPHAVVGSALYQNLPATGGTVFTTGAAAKGNALDDFDLPANLTGAGPASLKTMKVYLGNFDTVAHDVFATITFYDKLDFGAATATSVVSSRLAGYTFSLTAFPARTAGYVNLTLPAPLSLTHDYGTDSFSYGIQLAFYTTTARTAFQNQVAFVMPNAQYVQVGHSEDVYYRDASQDGTFTPDEARFFGGYPSLANFALELDGDAPNDLTYEINGTVTFPTVMVTTPSTPIKTVWQIHPHTAGASDIYISGTLDNFVPAIDPNTGAQMGEMTTYNLIGFPPDTYDVDIIPEGFVDQSVTVSTLDPVTMLNRNINSADATFNTPAGDVTGSIALDGVNDLSATNPAAPLGLFTLSFRTPGTTTELFHRFTPLTTAAMSPNGTFSVFGVPDGTYDVRIKGNKNLAALDAGVVVSSGGAAPAVTLPSGDANNDNKVDPTDFGIFVGAYNTNASVTNGGYDPTADFNFDGAVDPTDFGLFVGNYNSVGAP